MDKITHSSLRRLVHGCKRLVGNHEKPEQSRQEAATGETQRGVGTEAAQRSYRYIHGRTVNHQEKEEEDSEETQQHVERDLAQTTSHNDVTFVFSLPTCLTKIKELCRSTTTSCM